MDASPYVLGVLSAFFVLLAVPCLMRLVRAHPGAELSPQVDRVDELAELLMCVGMLAMVSPVGGPIPRAGWLTVFGLALAWLAVTWLRRLMTWGQAACGPSTCGHHAVSAAVMLYMFAAMQGHSGHHGDPWLTFAGHDGSLALPVLALAATLYLFVDMIWSLARIVRSRRIRSMPAVFGWRMRYGTRAGMSAAMATMLISMA